MTVHAVPDANRIGPETPCDGSTTKEDTLAQNLRRTTPARLGAAVALVGVAVEVPLTLVHPHHADPNDSKAAFSEYFTSHHWVLIHLGQYAGTLLIVLGLVMIGARAAQQGGLAGALARASQVTAVVTAAVFAVQMAVDGIALKTTVDIWVSASGGIDRVAAYHAAEAVRSVEKGLSALFHLNNGLTLMALGCALVLGGRAWRWVGWLGVAASAGFLVEAVVTALTGFSHQAGLVGLAPTVLLPAFLFAAAVADRGRRTEDANL